MEQYQQPGTPTHEEQPRRRRSRTETPVPEAPDPVPQQPEDGRSCRQPRINAVPEVQEDFTNDPQYLARAGYAPEQRTQYMPTVDPSRMYGGGQPVQPTPGAPVQVVVNNVNTVNANGTVAMESYFDGKLSQQIGYGILGFLVTVFTLGICFPWAVCMQYRWRIRHTVIQGRRLAFDGKASQLFGKWLLWMLLIIITLGIYAFWVSIALEKWRVKHTRYAR